MCIDNGKMPKTEAIMLYSYKTNSQEYKGTSNKIATRITS